MKILIIEDDQNKLKQISEFITQQFPDTQIVARFSYNSGIKEIFRMNHDIILLDMTMPTFDISPHEVGGRPRIYGGKDILRQMERRKINIPAIIVTQFEKFGEGSNTKSLSDLCEELEREHKNNYLGYVYYNAALDEWKDDLKNILTQAGKTKNKIEGNGND